MEFDCSPCVAVEVNNSEALRQIQSQSMVDWVMMVAPGIAIVVCNPPIANLETLKQFITYGVECNKGWKGQRVYDGASYCESMVLPKCLTNEAINEDKY